MGRIDGVGHQRGNACIGKRLAEVGGVDRTFIGNKDGYCVVVHSISPMNQVNCASEIESYRTTTAAGSSTMNSSINSDLEERINIETSRLCS